MIHNPLEHAQLDQKGATGGSKYDGGKPGLDLIDRSWLIETAKVLDFGAKKYAAYNWRGGIQYSRLTGAALRHILAFNDGEDNDPETGLSHLAHASCCLMFLTNFSLNPANTKLDDRYKAGDPSRLLVRGEVGGEEDSQWNGLRTVGVDCGQLTLPFGDDVAAPESGSLIAGQSDRSWPVRPSETARYVGGGSDAVRVR